MIDNARASTGSTEHLAIDPSVNETYRASPLVTPAAWMGVAATLGFIILAWVVVQNPAGAIDLGLLAWIQQSTSPTFDIVARWTSYLGSEAIAVMVIALLIWLAIRRQWRLAGLLVATVGGAQLLNDLLKEIFHRARPVAVAGLIPAQQYSFPSGHAMVSAAFYLFVLWLCWAFLPGWAHIPVLIALAFICLAIGIARMYVGAHYFTDVVAGGFAGFAWADGVLLAAHRIAGRNNRTVVT